MECTTASYKETGSKSGNSDGLRICHPDVAHSPPTASSTTGYRQPIHARQLRHWPRSASQLTSGTFSHQASVRPHSGNASAADHALALRPAAQAHVQKAAEGQPQQTRKYRS